MMIIMETHATKTQCNHALAWINNKGLTPHLSEGIERTVIGIVGNIRTVDHEQLLHLPGVDSVMPISSPYKLSSRAFHPEDSIINIGNQPIGEGQEMHIIAGPCSVESKTQIIETAHAVKEAGAHALRGGAFKPRTSPYSFQGLEEQGLEFLAEARAQTGLPIVTEVMSQNHVDMVANYADVLQIGARNMQNFPLLKQVGKKTNTILLKRGMAAKVDDLLMAAEYIISQGNTNILLCERGIRTFETATRNTTDINAIPVLKSLTHLPVILDPSHSTGHWEFVTAVAKAGIAAGADGLIIEVHLDPRTAFSDGDQSLKPAQFAKLITKVKAIAQAVGRKTISENLYIPQ